MTDQDGYGRFSAPGPSDPNGIYGGGQGYGSANPYGQPPADSSGVPETDIFGQPRTDSGASSTDLFGQPASSAHGQASADPFGQGSANAYGQPSASDPYVAPSADQSAADPYGSAPSASAAGPYVPSSAGPQQAAYAAAPAGYTGPTFGQGALPYGGPQQPGMYVAPPSSGAATAALVLGIISLVCFPATGPVAIVLGVMGMRATSDGRQSGRGMAVTGLVLGILGSLYLIGVIIYIAFIIIFGAYSASTY